MWFSWRSFCHTCSALQWDRRQRTHPFPCPEMFSSRRHLVIQQKQGNKATIGVNAVPRCIWEQVKQSPYGREFTGYLIQKKRFPFSGLGSNSFSYYDKTLRMPSTLKHFLMTGAACSSPTMDLRLLNMSGDHMYYGPYPL